MKTKTAKTAKPAAPVAASKPKRDERKLFFGTTYKMSDTGNQLRLMQVIGKNGKEQPFDSEQEAIEGARAHLSNTQGAAYYSVDGVIIFESIALVKPKKVEVEIESFPVIKS